MKKVMVYIPDEIYEWLRKYSFKKRVSMSGLIKMLLEKEKNG